MTSRRGYFDDQGVRTGRFFYSPCAWSPGSQTVAEWTDDTGRTESGGSRDRRLVLKDKGVPGWGGMGSVRRQSVNLGSNLVRGETNLGHSGDGHFGFRDVVGCSVLS